MRDIKKIQKLRALKEEMNSKLSALKEAKKAKMIAEKKNSLASLFEGELEKAQIILAAKDVLDRLQKMAEDLAKMTAEDIMPISDNMKGIFGTEVSDQFEQVANEQLAAGLEAIRTAKDQLNTQVLRMEGKVSDEDAMPTNDMMNDDEGTEGDDSGDLDLDLGGEDEEGTGDDSGDLDLDLGSDEDSEGSDDLFGGDESAATGEPLGRAKKESFRNKGKSLSESAKKKRI